MSDTTLRQWVMLTGIPRAPRKASNADIQELLQDNGFDVSLRTIQRDLRKLSSVFPIAADEHKPLGWFWYGPKTFDLPGMDVHTAIAFQLAGRYLEPLLPRTTRAYLDPHFARAREVLAKVSGNKLSEWPSRIRSIPSGLPLQPPKVHQHVLEAVHEALLERRALAIRYRKRGDTRAKPMEFHPLGLVYRDAVAYLVGTFWSYADIVQLAVHRITQAEVSEAEAREQADFDLEAYCASGAFDYLLDDAPLNVTLRVHPVVAPRFTETPVSRDQTVASDDDGWLQVSFTVAETTQLHAWLRSFGAYVEVVSPKILRKSFAEQARRVAALYEL